LKCIGVNITWITLFFICAPFGAGQSETPSAGEREAFTKAIAAAEPAERIKSLEQFLKDYPTGTNLSRARMALFEATVKTGKPNFDYAEKAIEANPEGSRAGAYSTVARALADSDQSLDRAYAYIKQGVDLARKQDANKRMLGRYLDTMALIEYKLGDFAAAEKNEREAMESVSRRDTMPGLEYSSRLGRILARRGGKNEEAADLLATALLLGDSRNDAEQLEDLVKALASANPQGRKAELLKKAAEKYLDAATDKAAARSKIAVGYARNDVQKEQALAQAQQAIDALTPKSSVESFVDFNRALGFVHSYQKNHAEAVACLQKIAPLIPAYDPDFFQRLGYSLEALGQDEAALETYLQGTLESPTPRIMDPLKALYKKMNGSEAGLKERISGAADAAARFAPKGPAKTSPSGRVVLAELFTGSECPPCVASDLAFDNLMAGYERKAVVVLEYHLHIPRPDPMTNKDTEARAKFYSVNSTPSVLLGGVEKLVGGGSKNTSKNRYDLYSYVIDQKLATQSPASVEVEGSLNKSVLSVKAGAKAPGSAGDLKLRVALVEDVVHFKGSNNLSEHRSVVRRMIGSPEGIALKDGKASLAEEVDIAALVQSLKDYLDKYEQEPPSGSAANREFKFKEKKHEIDAGNLSLVAFIQNDETKEILQACYFRMPQSDAAKPATH